MKRRIAVPVLSDLIDDTTGNVLEIMKLAEAEALRMDRYLSWQELRYRKPPTGLTVNEWWLGIKIHRAQARQTIPLYSAKGVPFSFAPVQYIMQLLHEVDRKGGIMLMTDANEVFCNRERDKYLLTSIEEESIMSSKLEGAVMTRSEARALLRDNRNPKDEHEKMVINNYLTMKRIIENKDKPLTPGFILSLHRSMVEGTLKHPEKAGALRNAEDNVCIEDIRSGDIVHMPPAAEELSARLEALCRFANGEDDSEYYIHPVIRAIILHFQLAYDHPFVDGNGRTARALFYWAMLRAGYWMFEYTSISQGIFLHSGRYYESFLNTEEDENDLNYFIINQLTVMVDSINKLIEYVQSTQKTKNKYQQYVEERLTFLNNRQQQVLLNFWQHPDTHTSVSIHCNTYKVTRQTARTDLKQLVDLGLLSVETVSRRFLFKPEADMEKRVIKLAESK